MVANTMLWVCFSVAGHSVQFKLSEGWKKPNAKCDRLEGGVDTNLGLYIHAESRKKSKFLHLLFKGNIQRKVKDTKWNAWGWLRGRWLIENNLKKMLRKNNIKKRWKRNRTYKIKQEMLLPNHWTVISFIEYRDTNEELFQSAETWAWMLVQR